MKKQRTRSVGIDAMAVYAPRLFVDLAGDWSEARARVQGMEPAKLAAKVTTGIGVRRMAIPDAHEDSATMAAMAVKRLIEGAQLDPTQIGYLAVATETTVDQSKSIGAYVLGMLERHYRVDLSHVGCPQFQFACIGATYALEAAAALVRAGDLGARSAIVVATDIARYPLGGQAECTQGAGAVAMRVAYDPALLRLDPGAHWTVTLDERDFFRPNWCSEAVVDGQYSVDTYLSCIDRAVSAACATPGGRRAIADADSYLFHVPFPRMAEYAATRLYRRLFERPAGGGHAAADDGRAREREADRALLRSEAFRSWFAAHCAPALTYAPEIGNIYSGAIYLSLATLIEAVGRGTCSGRRVVFFSYGSGASAKLFTGALTEGARLEGIAAHLELAGPENPRGRVPLALRDYERLHRDHVNSNTTGQHAPGSSVHPPEDEFALLRFGQETSTERTDVGYRYYGFVPPRAPVATPRPPTPRAGTTSSALGEAGVLLASDASLASRT